MSHISDVIGYATWGEGKNEFGPVVSASVSKSGIIILVVAGNQTTGAGVALLLFADRLESTRRSARKGSRSRVYVESRVGPREPVSGRLPPSVSFTGAVRSGDGSGRDGTGSS